MSETKTELNFDKISEILRLLTEHASEKNCQCKVRELLDKVDFE